MIRWIAIFYLGSMFFFAWGMATIRYEIFPYSYVYPLAHNIINFFHGHENENSTLGDKIKAEIGIAPMRTFGDFQRIYSRKYRALQVDNLNDRRSEPEIYSVQEKVTPGYKFIFGVFDFEEDIHGAILLDNKQQVVHQWQFSKADTLAAVAEHNRQLRETSIGHEDKTIKNVEFSQPEIRFPHGVVLLRDGSVIYIDGDNSNGIMRVDVCGNREWTNIGKFDHAVSLALDEKSIWAVSSNNFALIDKSNGKLLRNIFLREVAIKNPEVNVLHIRRNIGKGIDLHDPHHVNDIEPLPKEYAHSFPMFEAGDLLTSLRSLDLILVFDPESLKIKWWRAGQFRRQHDPDWQPDGTITVYENNMKDLYHTKYQDLYSRIWKIDPATYEAEVIYDGKEDSFYSGIRGKHQVLPNGNILITISDQGRVIEVTPEGETVFDFLNIYDEQRNLLVSEAIWVPEDYFNFELSKNSSCL